MAPSRCGWAQPREYRRQLTTVPRFVESVLPRILALIAAQFPPDLAAAVMSLEAALVTTLLVVGTSCGSSCHCCGCPGSRLRPHPPDRWLGARARQAPGGLYSTRSLHSRYSGQQIFG